MEGRDRVNSSPRKGLLGRQLASISDTLAKASARRDAEVQRRLSPQPQLATTPDLSSRPSSTNSSLTSDAQGTIGSEFGRSVAFAGGHTGFVLQSFGHPNLNLPQTATFLG